MERERNHPFKEIFGRTRMSFDLDGVVFLIDIPAVEKFNKDFGTSKTPLETTGWSTVTNWAYEEFIKRGFKSDQAIKMAAEYDRTLWSDQEIYRRAPLAPGVETFIRRLRSLEIPFDFITSRQPALKNVTYECFAEKLPLVDSSQIFINSDLGVLGHDFKVSKIAERGIGLHFEDYDEHGRLILKSTAASVVLLCYPYGTDLKDPRLTKIEVSGRQAYIEDFYKKLLLNSHLINVAQSIDNIPPLG